MTPRQETLAQTTDLAENLSSRQSTRLAKLLASAEEGSQSQQQATAYYQAAADHLANHRVLDAQEANKQAHALRQYLDQTTAAEVAQQGKLVQAKVAEEKTLIKKLFKQSAAYYRQGLLDQAQAGFQQVIDSGIDLGFFDRGGDLNTANAYLTKIEQRQAEIMPSETLTQSEPAAAEAQEMAMTAEPSETEMMTETQVVAVAVPVPMQDATFAEPVPGDDIVVIEPVTESLPMAEVQVIEVEPAPAVALAEPTTQKAPTEKKKDSLLDFSWLSGKSKKKELTAADIDDLNRAIARGDVAMNQGRYAVAKEYYTAALAINPDSLDAQRGAAGPHSFISISPLRSSPPNSLPSWNANRPDGRHAPNTSRPACRPPQGPSTASWVSSCLMRPGPKPVRR